MSQEQPRKPEDQKEAVTYGDVFPGVQGVELADKLVAPKDAAIMQAEENAVLGKTIKGGAAATLQTAARQNEKAGVVGPDDMNANIVTGDEGVSVKEAELPGRRIITESIAGQVPYIPFPCVCVCVSIYIYICIHIILTVVVFCFQGFLLLFGSLLIGLGFGFKYKECRS